MPKAKCPECATVVTYRAGYDPVCPGCGFRGEAPAPAPPPMRWASVPEPAPVPMAVAAPVAYAVPAYAAPRPSNGMATAGLTLGILGLVFFWVPFLGQVMAVLGAALGGAGLAAANRDPELASTRGTAIAGLALGVAAFLFGMLVWDGIFGVEDGPWWDF